MNPDSKRFRRELKTVKAMVELYCRDTHKEHPCMHCQNLLDYVEKQLRHCPHGEKKPTCSDCPVHCYKPAMRNDIRKIMKYSGPRLVFSHPILSLRHFLDHLQSGSPET